MNIKTTKIIIAMAAAAILAACNEGQDFYQASSVNANYRSDQHAQTTGGTPPVGFYKGEPPRTGRGATGAPPSTTATTTSDAQVPASAPSDAAPPSTTSVPASAPAAASSEVPPSTTTAAPPSTAQ